MPHLSLEVKTTSVTPDLTVRDGKTGGCGAGCAARSRLQLALEQGVGIGAWDHIYFSST